ncbi:MAG: alanine racemase [Rhodobacteraceae bacterium]|nr:MAG: alanine racemase [Paracoccaceae bacterium]
MTGALTIDLGAIRANWRALAGRVRPARCAAVVKADAYGLGLAQVAPALLAEGARVFFVATAEEALAARAVLGESPAVFCFNGPDADTVDALAEARVRPLLNGPEQVALARAAARRRGAAYACGLQLDTGMNRLGLEADELAAALAEGLDGLDVGLAMSHLACADDPAHPMNAAQRLAFAAMTAHPVLAGVPRSLSATGGALLGPGFAFDLVRPGVGLYGGLPFADARPVVTLDVPVIQTRAVAPGEAVGYGATWVAERPSRIATIAAGYADGLHRALSNRGGAFHAGRRLPFAGRVSMDLIGLDVTEAPDVSAGDRVTLLGPEQGVDALAAAAGTIGYEILTSLGTRYARRYVGASDP